MSWKVDQVAVPRRRRVGQPGSCADRRPRSARGLHRPTQISQSTPLKFNRFTQLESPSAAAHLAGSVRRHSAQSRQLICSSTNRCWPGRTRITRCCPPSPPSIHRNIAASPHRTTNRPNVLVVIHAAYKPHAPAATRRDSPPPSSLALRAHFFFTAITTTSPSPRFTLASDAELFITFPP